MNDEIITA